jgi:hypothetical protein
LGNDPVLLVLVIDLLGQGKIEIKEQEQEGKGRFFDDEDENEDEGKVVQSLAQWAVTGAKP